MLSSHVCFGNESQPLTPGPYTSRFALDYLLTPRLGLAIRFSPAPLAAAQTTLEMADSLGIFIGPELLQQINAHDARIRSILNQPNYQRPEPIYAVLFIGLDPKAPGEEALTGLPWGSLHMLETSLASTVIFFTLEKDYLDRINNIDHTRISPKAQMIIYKMPGESEWTTRLLLSRL